jgi:Methyladenine glycosylase
LPECDGRRLDRMLRHGHEVGDAALRPRGKRQSPVCAELLIFDTNQQFATHRIRFRPGDLPAVLRSFNAGFPFRISTNLPPTPVGLQTKLSSPVSNQDAFNGVPPSVGTLSPVNLPRSRISWTNFIARAFLAVQREFGTFDRYLWRFVDGHPIVNAPRSLRDLPAETPRSRALSKDLIRRGFRFVGPKICYAFMQSVGLVNDHIVGCFRRRPTAKSGDSSG